MAPEVGLENSNQISQISDSQILTELTSSPYTQIDSHVQKELEFIVSNWGSLSSSFREAVLTLIQSQLRNKEV